MLVVEIKPKNDFPWGINKRVGGASTRRLQAAAPPSRRENVSAFVDTPSKIDFSVGFQESTRHLRPLTTGLTALLDLHCLVQQQTVAHFLPSKISAIRDHTSASAGRKMDGPHSTGTKF